MPRFVVPEWVKDTPKICAAMTRIMRQVAPIAKERRNTFHKYDFRGIDDVWNMIHDVLAEAGVWISPEMLSRTETTKNTKNDGTNVHAIVKMNFYFIAEDGSQAVVGPIFGEGMDSGDKSTNKGTSMSAKIAFLNAFAIATKEGERDDNDNASPEVAPEQKATATGRAIGPDTAVKIYEAFGAVGVTRDQLHRKLQCANVADVPDGLLQTIRSWKDACAQNKANIGKIFGGSSPTARAAQ